MRILAILTSYIRTFRVDTYASILGINVEKKGEIRNDSPLVCNKKGNRLIEILYAQSNGVEHDGNAS